MTSQPSMTFWQFQVKKFIALFVSLSMLVTSDLYSLMSISPTKLSLHYLCILNFVKLFYNLIVNFSISELCTITLQRVTSWRM